jgi:hypothetical protein
MPLTEFVEELYDLHDVELDSLSEITIVPVTLDSRPGRTNERKRIVIRQIVRWAPRRQMGVFAPDIGHRETLETERPR